MGKKADVGLLIMIGVLFCASVGILHGRKKVEGVVAQELVKLSVQDAIDFVSPFLISGSIDSAAQAMNQLDERVITKMLAAIIHDRGPQLEESQKIAFIVGTAHYNPAIQNSLFGLLKKHFSSAPVFYIGIQNNFSDVVPALLSWAKDRPRILTQWIFNSLQEAIFENNSDSIDQLYAQGIRLDDKQDASKLLHYVVSNNKNVALVPFLVKHLGADANYSADGRKTLLIEAVERNNEAMVQALLEAGANPDLILSDEVGKASQIAYERGYLGIEQLLRSAK